MRSRHWVHRDAYPVLRCEVRQGRGRPLPKRITSQPAYCKLEISGHLLSLPSVQGHAKPEQNARCVHRERETLQRGPGFLPHPTQL